MGFFSNDCEGCGHPLLSPMAANEVNRWMSQGVAVMRHGDIIKGEYDGYGNLDGSIDQPVSDDSTVYHKACWKVQDCPTEYRGASKRSADQGWFFDDSDHDVAKPKTQADLIAARRHAEAVTESRVKPEPYFVDPQPTKLVHQSPPSEMSEDGLELADLPIVIKGLQNHVLALRERVGALEEQLADTNSEFWEYRQHHP